MISVEEAVKILNEHNYRQRSDWAPLWTEEGYSSVASAAGPNPKLLSASFAKGVAEGIGLGLKAIGKYQ